MPTLCHCGDQEERESQEAEEEDTGKRKKEGNAYHFSITIDNC